MLSINSLISETAKKWKRKAKIYREKRNYFCLLNENGEVKKNHTAALQERVAVLENTISLCTKYPQLRLVKTTIQYLNLSSPPPLPPLPPPSPKETIKKS